MFRYSVAAACNLLVGTLLFCSFNGNLMAAEPLNVGIIGLDTSHVIAFTNTLNDPEAPPEHAGCKVVAAYPIGSPDIESSVSRREGYTKKLSDMGVEIVETIPELMKRVDVVLLETNDGRPHWEQARQVIDAGKPLFIDKPLGGSLAECIAIFEYAKKKKVPVFSSSALRFAPGTQAIRNGEIGRVTAVDSYSPCSLEPTHPDLFWYGIHGVEALFTALGPGCQSVRRTHTKNHDVVVGIWSDGRIGTFRGVREGKVGYGGMAFGERATAPLGGFAGYQPLLTAIVSFFKDGKPPVASAETIEIYAFMEAADESKRTGDDVKIADVMEVANTKAKELLSK